MFISVGMPVNKCFLRHRKRMKYASKYEIMLLNIFIKIEYVKTIVI
jgi:hypothetical protein